MCHAKDKEGYNYLCLMGKDSSSHFYTQGKPIYETFLC